MRDLDRSESMPIGSPGVTRRGAVVLGAAGLAAAMTHAGQGGASSQVATPVASAEATPEGEGVYLLFVQSYAACTLTPSGEAGLFTLVLEHGTGQTLYFSDRPNRFVGMIETGKFTDVFREETAGDPANAALVAQISATEEAMHVVELLDMEYDAAMATSTFTVKLLDDPTALDMQFSEVPQQNLTAPVSYGTSQMFIDSGGLMQLVAYGAQD